MRIPTVQGMAAINEFFYGYHSTVDLESCIREVNSENRLNRESVKNCNRDCNELVHTDSIGAFLDACSMVIMEHCGGASGPIWGSAFRTAGRFAGNRRRLEMQEFADMMQAAVGGIQAVGQRSFGRGAVVGDKTLIDALVPCADAWSACAARGMGFHEAFFEAAASAVKGAKDTEKIVARMGLAGAVGERSLGYPDAGAYALGVIFTELAESIRR